MFGNKQSADSTGNPGKGMLVSNRINHGTELTGELVSDGDIRVEGAHSGHHQMQGKGGYRAKWSCRRRYLCKSVDVEGRVKEMWK